MSIDSFQGVPTEGTVINIVDPYTDLSDAGFHMGYLRSLPFLFRQGVKRYTFPPSWLRVKSKPTFNEVLVEENEHYRYRVVQEFAFEYDVIGADRESRKLEFSHLCQYTSQDIDEYADESTTYKILRAYKQGQIEELFLVTDSADFRIEDTVAGKPLVEDLPRVEPLSYEKLSKQYIQSTLGKRRLGYGETLNIWLHHAAAEYEDVMGVEPTRIANLFEFDALEPGIRTWEILEFLASDMSKQEPDHISAVTRPFVESDNSVIESHIRNALQEFNYDREAVREYRQTGSRPV